jgi:hypothetical protein
MSVDKRKEVTWQRDSCGPAWTSARSITGLPWSTTRAQCESRKLANDEQQIGAFLAEVDALGGRVSWTVDLTTVHATLPSC